MSSWRLAVERVADDHLALRVRQRAHRRHRPVERLAPVDDVLDRVGLEQPVGIASACGARARFSDALRAIRYSHAFSANGARPPISAAWALMKLCCTASSAAAATRNRRQYRCSGTR